MKKVIRLTESDLHRIVKNSVKKILKERKLNENIEDFYSEEDSNGNTGKPGQVKSYEVGWNNSVDNFEKEAEENGMSLEEFLKTWWEETYPHEFTWQTLGRGYGHNGSTILTLGDVRFKEIYGQLMIDEYAPKELGNEMDFNSRLNKGEYYMK